MSAQQGLTPELAVGFRAVMLDGGLAVIYQDVVPSGDARLMGGA